MKKDGAGERHRVARGVFEWKCDTAWKAAHCSKLRERSREFLLLLVSTFPLIKLSYAPR